MEFGLTLRMDDQLKPTAELAQLAEDNGFEYVYLADRHKQYRDVYVHLAYIAEETDRIMIGPGVTNPVSRDPIVTANSIATIDELSGGRAILGLGRGGNPTCRALGRDEPASFAETAECIRILRGFWSGSEFERAGNMIGLEWGYQADVPIYIAAGGPHMNKFAGRFGDGVIIANINYQPVLETKLQQVADARDTRSNTPTSAIKNISHLTTMPSFDADRAVRFAKPRVLETVVRKPGIAADCGLTLDLDQYERVHETLPMKPYVSDWKGAIDNASVVDDQVVRRLALAGDPDSMIEQLTELEESGIDQMFLRPFFYHELDALEEANMEFFIRFFGDHVIPHFTN